MITNKFDIKNMVIKRIDETTALAQSASMQTTISDTLTTTHHHQIYFSAEHDNEMIGMLAISSTTLSNVNIDYLAVKQPNLLQAVGEKLVRQAEQFCYEGGYTSVTVEYRYAKQNDLTANPIHYFLTHSGFKPLYEFATNEKESTLLLQKILTLNDFTFIDLTHTLTSDVPHWGVDVGFKYNARYIETPEAAGHLKFRVQRLEMSSGIGTHMDAPSHCFETAVSIDKIPLQSLITPCRVIDVSKQAHDKYSVSADDILNFEAKFGMIPKNSFVIIRTGWDTRWSVPLSYRNDKIFPYISVEAAKLLLSREITGIGIDTLSPDAFGSNFPVHELMLSAGKFIIENVANSGSLDPADSYIFALPMKIADGTEAPVRLIGMVRKPPHPL